LGPLDSEGAGSDPTAPLTSTDGADAVVAPSRDSAGYRPALDGIRAFAVLAVIAYHFGYRWAPGGFVGVDVFFVLSGYLITSLLLAEHARTGGIAFLAFWFRRARRLLPALFVMLFVVAIYVGLHASPFEMPMLRADLFWTLFYGSNWHFVQSGQDYFAQYASASPLRHTWSLAIEEQFYGLWPLIVAGALWAGRKRPAVLAVVCAAGIAASAAAMAIAFDPLDPSRAYYGTDTRMHQLLIGALLAVLMSQRDRLARFRPVAGVIAALAGVGLLASFAMIHDQSAAYYHGLSVLLAVMTAALICAVELDNRQPVARLLSMRPVAWIGEISYGLYLWHWPVILAIASVPAPIASLPGASTGLNLTRLVATFGIAIASFYLVERPIRRGSMPVLARSARRFAVAAGVSILLLSGVAMVATAADPREVSTLPVPDCAPYEICVRHQGPAGAPVVAVVGDSIALSLDPGFVALATERGWTYVLQANYSCRVGHVMSVATPKNASVLPACYAKTPGLQAELLATWHPKVVVMADLMDTLEIQADAGHRIAAGSDQGVALQEEALTDIARLVTESGSKMALLKLPPNLTIGPDCQKPSNFRTPGCTFRVAGDWIGAPYDAMYERLAKKLPGVTVLSVTPAVCPNNVCRPLVAGVMMRSDGLHFTPDGAKAIMPMLGRQILETGALP
jgi:peptidoglycan/LPS O-acetylase OafA/YrhL